MNLTAPPPVQDPVPCDVDDAVIKEAKRRARRRRFSYAAVAAAALATVAALLAWSPHRRRARHRPTMPVALQVLSVPEAQVGTRATRQGCGRGSSGCRPREPRRAARPRGTWCSR